jgi:hypothetical protein
MMPTATDVVRLVCAAEGIDLGGDHPVVRAREAVRRAGFGIIEA